MFRKSFAGFLVIMLSSAIVFAQKEQPKPKPSADVYRALALAGESGGYLGIRIRDVSKENMAQYGLRDVRGVAIEKVLDDSPAARSGLMSSDVIVRFNGEEVTSVRKLNRLIGEVAPDHTVRIAVLRNSVEQSFDVTIGKREFPKLFDGDFKFETFPPMEKVPGVNDFPLSEFLMRKDLPDGKPGDKRTFVWSSASSRQIGVSVTDLTKQLGDYFGVSDGKGLLISNVREDSPAAKAGLVAGDVIVEIDGYAVNHSFELVKAINAKETGDVSVTVIRNKSRRIVSVSPEASKGGVFRLGEDFEKLFEANPEMTIRRITPKPKTEPLKLVLKDGSEF